MDDPVGPTALRVSGAPSSSSAASGEIAKASPAIVTSIRASLRSSCGHLTHRSALIENLKTKYI